MQGIPSRIGQYDVIRLLGAGGMATVYLAEDEHGHPVAIKLIRSEHRKNDVYVRRFKRECRAIGALRHPNLVSLLDFGIHEEMPYAVLEYLPGKNLLTCIETDGVIDQPGVLDMASSLLEACSYYHAKGLVHRDIKPSNIVIDKGNRPVIVDFGLVFAADQTRLTKTGRLAGTPCFLPPEVLRGNTMDIRNDLFQFGVVFFFCLTGQLPFPGSTSAIVMTNILQGRANSLVSLVPALSTSAAIFVANLCAFDVEKRYQNPDEANRDLGLVLAGKDIGLLEENHPFTRQSEPRDSAAAEATTAPRRHKVKSPSSSSRSSAPQRERTGAHSTIATRRWLFMLSICLSILFTGLGIRFLPTSPQQPLRATRPQPRLVVGHQRVRVDWVSPRAGQVRVELLDGQATVIARYEDREPTRTHTFLLDIDRAASQSTIVVTVLPRGPSSARLPVRTYPITPTITDARYEQDRLDITLAPLPNETEMTCTVRANTWHDSTSTSASRTARCRTVGQGLVATIEGIGPGLNLLEGEITIPATNERLVVDLAPPFRQWAARQYDRCAGQRYGPIVTGIVTKAISQLLRSDEGDLRAFSAEGDIDERDLSKMSLEQRKRVLNKVQTLVTWSREQKWGRLLRFIGERQELLLSTPLIPLRQSCTFFQMGQAVRGLNAAFSLRGWPLFAERQFPFGAHWQLEWRQAPPMATWQVLLRRTLSQTTFEVLGMADQVLGSSRRNLDIEFSIAENALENTRRALLCLDVLVLPPRAYIKMDVNDSVQVSIPFDGTHQSGWLCQFLPRALFIEGNNKIRLGAEVQPGYFRARRHTRIRTIAVLVEPAS